MSPTSKCTLSAALVQTLRMPKVYPEFQGLINQFFRPLSMQVLTQVTHHSLAGGSRPQQLLHCLNDCLHLR